MTITREFVHDPSLVLYLPLYKLDGAEFSSQDAYGHLCTVNGALRTPQGRTFDGIDDWISLANFAPSMPSTGSILFWVYTPDWADAGDYYLLDIAEGAGLNQIYIRKLGGGGSVYRLYTAALQINLVGAILSAGWHHYALAYTTNDFKAFIDVAPDGVDTSCDMPSFVSSVGALGATRDGSANHFKGTMGECTILSRILTTLEIQQHYEATKWRYQ